jgi:adenylylsulfate kinase
MPVIAGSKFLVFLTGFSGSGKSTLAEATAKRLKSSVILDGDEVRKVYGNPPHGANGLETTTERMINLASNHFQSKSIVITSFVAPRADLRDKVRQAMERKGIRFIEVFVDASLNLCASRDVKGLYRKYRDGENIRLAGLNEPYDVPIAPDVICRTGHSSIKENVDQILNALKS